MFKPRPYQQEAIDACFSYLNNNEGNPILCLPTGAGKSIVIAEIAKQALQYEGTRVLVVTHVKELIEQNYLKMPPEMNAGIYSAGVGRRNTHNRLLFCGIQSIYKKADIFGKVDLVIIDECHLLSPKQDTMYGKFLEELNPSRIIGLTATPYRTGDGLLTDSTLFSDIAYNLPMTRLIDEGYLSPLKSKGGVTEVDTSGIKITAGEFNKKDMALAFDQDDITRVAVEEILRYGQDRKSCLIFGSSVEHCYHIQDYIDGSVVITGDTDKYEREKQLMAFKAGAYKYLINYGVLTTGFDAPSVDLIALLRSTKSTSLYVQMLGRGMRTAEGKDHCLVLDYGQNIVRFGAVDAINITSKRKKDGTIVKEISLQPTKLCPECRFDNHVQVNTCPHCGYEYPIEINHDTEASTEAIMSSDMKTYHEHPVSDVRYSKHKKEGKPPSLRVNYITSMGAFSEWICLEHTGYAQQKARSWWNNRAGTAIPKTVDEALEKQGEILIPEMIQVKKEGKYDRICGYIGQRKSHKIDNGTTVIDELGESFDQMF